MIEDARAINRVLDNFHQAASEADGKAYFAAFSRRGVFIGTDASERWTVAQFKTYAEPYFSQGKGWTYTPHHRTLDQAGDTAWFDELLDNDKYGLCRGSGVLVKEAGQWKIVQYHLTFPIPNALAGEITEMIKTAGGSADN